MLPNGPLCFRLSPKRGLSHQIPCKKHGGDNVLSLQATDSENLDNNNTLPLTTQKVRQLAEAPAGAYGLLAVVVGVSKLPHRSEYPSTLATLVGSRRSELLRATR